MPQLQVLDPGTKDIVINTILTPEQFKEILDQSMGVFILRQAHIDFETGFARIKFSPGNGIVEINDSNIEEVQK